MSIATNIVGLSIFDDPSYDGNAIENKKYTIHFNRRCGTISSFYESLNHIIIDPACRRDDETIYFKFHWIGALDTNVDAFVGLHDWCHP